MNEKLKKQFDEMKAKHQDAILLFRVGDFYESYEEDAEIVAKELGITLTKKGNTKMAGFPHHSLDNYLPKLVRAGKRVAMCDQLEDPKLTKKLVKRGITEDRSSTSSVEQSTSSVEQSIASQTSNSPNYGRSKELTDMGNQAQPDEPSQNL
jgi:DNA mismatch repair ATPase MutS